ncbi:MAG: hypothetical protein US30_C0008G0015 [Candidatus Moranbacteria bacterium GW2011_GWF2_36_839]|nr:MAG: hypothetical protein US27_C0008G0015 [Candidatus Moranbacteria bacterium GW2011_GWF1_36_78]KKQ16997.1 MAG: hypothetical protein US30_C0008G0015 [Candidatus Moranbacteria bacterium GW2011_GWF2_36_839]HAT74009.1 hypothetical protein [Candidatus Moranbacteria bacterium]HBY11173.1 hypothetical protein [Candidatus Moranbacteria bacterium]
MPGKVKYHNLSDNQKKKYLGDFYTMVSLLENRDEVKNFFKDLLILSEVVMISRRIQVAKMLFEGYTHDEIRKEMKVGFSTVSQVERWLNNGFGGYRKTIEEYQKKYKDNPKVKNSKPFKSGMMKKYPFHYLLWDMINKK